MTKHKHSEVIHAWADGATIKYSWVGETWVIAKDPMWSEDIQYRVKKQEYEEYSFQDAELLIGKIIKRKDPYPLTEYCVALITALTDKYLIIGQEYISYKELLNLWEFLDGSVCGKLK